jgi:hypothetical protein
MRSIADPFVVRLPAGARVRTRLRLTPVDEAVLRAVGAHLGRLAGHDLAWRCRLGRSDDQRTVRKHAATSQSSSRWAGTITRTSNDQWQRGLTNLANHQLGLRRAVRSIRTRLAVPVGGKQGRVHGYATQAERYAKQRRLQHLEGELAKVEDRLSSARVSVCRGGHRLAKLRHRLDHVDVKLTEAEWQACWQARRWFLTADGDATKRWGNETIRVHPEQQWLELRLPTPMAGLSNTPGRACTYRLACPVTFHHRRDEWAVQAATGPVRYDISYQPGRNRWYLDASWQTKATQPPAPDELRRSRALGVDLNADHLACWVLDSSGNPVGRPHTIPLYLDALSTSTRDGRLRVAIAALLRLARTNGCRSIVVEDLDFTDARLTGRETLGRGRRARCFRKIISGMPIRRFRSFLAGMAANADLWVIAVDPSWTSKWGQRYWLAPLNRSTKSSIAITRHHAAAVVIARRGQGVGARRRQGVAGHDQRIVAGELPARPDQRLPDHKGPGPPGGQRAAARPWKTRPAERSKLGNQVVQDRSGPPGRPYVLLNSVGTVPERSRRLTTLLTPSACMETP